VLHNGHVTSMMTRGERFDVIYKNRRLHISIDNSEDSSLLRTPSPHELPLTLPVSLSTEMVKPQNPAPRSDDKSGNFKRSVTLSLDPSSITLFSRTKNSKGQKESVGYAATNNAT